MLSQAADRLDRELRFDEVLDCKRWHDVVIGFGLSGGRKTNDVCPELCDFAVGGDVGAEQFNLKVPAPAPVWRTSPR